MERRTDINKLNDDILEGIFFRLSVKEIALSKCVSKKWYIIMSEFAFRYNASKSTDISGLFFQQLEELDNSLSTSIVHIPVEMEILRMQENCLTFLPERVSMMSSNNGLLCCRSLLNRGGWEIKRDQNIYVCNPTSKEFIRINSPKEGLGVSIGLTVDLIHRSFQLVSIICHENQVSSTFFTFSIFSSDTWSWRLSKEVCKWNSKIFMNKQVFVNGRFHWLTINNHLITFQIENETSGIIKLPGPVMNVEEGHRGMCLGSSEGYLNYIVVHPSEIRIWVLISYEIPEWILTRRINLIQFCEEHLLSQFRPQLIPNLERQLENEETNANTTVGPLAFVEDVIFMDMNYWHLVSFNLKTGALKNHCFRYMLWDILPWEIFLSGTVLPYKVNLAAMNVLKRIGPGTSTIRDPTNKC